MSVHYESDRVTVHHGDCLDVLRGLPDASVDAVVTDPPYGLEFMGREWDAPWKSGAAHAEARTLRADEMLTESKRRYIASGVNKYEAGAGFQAWCEQWAAECLRVLKPGGHLLAFGGTRTWHRLACAIEDAGFEIRDNLAWMYGSGFPKSLDVSKAIDKAAGAEREVVGRTLTPFRVDAAAERGTSLEGSVNGDFSRQTEGGYRYTEVTAPATPDAARWQGWGTALKPAYEPIVLARKPLAGTVAANVLAHGTGALNVDGCRVETGDNLNGGAYATSPTSRKQMWGAEAGNSWRRGGAGEYVQPPGRWPANVVLDEAAAAMLDEQSGPAGSNGTSLGKSDGTRSGRADLFAERGGHVIGRDGHDTRADGGASRFFYTAKAGSDERPRARRKDGEDNATSYGRMRVRECNACGNRTNPAGGQHSGRPWPACGHDDWTLVEQQSAKDEYVAHPTVKPLDLMRWLVRLVTPPGGTVLEPFAGSGTTVEACILEGFRCVAIEREADYLPLIMQRVHRRVDPVAHHAATRADDDEPSLFDLLGGDAA